MNREDVAKRNASIVRDMRNGMRIRDVMKKYDVSRYTCYRTMQSVNRKERQANYSDWKAKRDEEIVNRYADGVPAEQLAKEYSVHRATIYHILSEHNKDYLRQRDAKRPNATQLAREARQQTFIEAVKAIAPTFGGINLEDIKAPECFKIEQRLKEELDIPVMHDDQHGTAIISSAGLINALEVAGKKIEDVKIVVNGAGASAVSCTKLYVSLGARLENIVMLDSKGVISKQRTDLNEQKKYFATDRTDVHTLEEAIKGADVFLGLSKGNVLTQDMVRSMADHPIVFALANPTPEISYEDAMASRPDVLMSTGRSDYPNQINNVIGFPYIFRGALDTRATAINEEMKLAAVRAIAGLAKKPVPDVVNEAYHVNNLTFGPEYFIPKPVDPRLITEVSMAVAKAAMESGVARKQITDWEAYKNHLRELMGQENKLTRQLYETARRCPQRVVFAEGTHPNMLKAAVEAKAEGICNPAGIQPFRNNAHPEFQERNIFHR